VSLASDPWGSVPVMKKEAPKFTSDIKKKPKDAISTPSSNRAYASSSPLSDDEPPYTDRPNLTHRQTDTQQ
jgi:hypothetical protein